ncbi:MAG: hypothetical protein IT312_01390 [Anaerolineales bacterium]|nr:hypothetical protein [Anaerolineales bacterium]
MLNDNDDLPSAGTDPFAPPPKEKSLRPRLWLWLSIAGGGLFMLFGCLMAFAGTSIQLEAQENWEGYYAFLMCCPLPLVVLGIVLLIVGASPLLKQRQIE